MYNIYAFGIPLMIKPRVVIFIHESANNIVESETAFDLGGKILEMCFPFNKYK